MKIHACMLEDSLDITSLPPLTSRWRVVINWFRQFLLPATWHHASKLYFSEKSLDNERNRQLQSAYWMVIHPYSAFQFYWSCYILLIFSASQLYMPFKVFISCPSQNDLFVIFTDITGFFAIIIRFFSAYVDDDGKKIILEPWMITKKYIKDTFFLDVIACLPMYSIIRSSCKFPTYTIAYSLKLLRIIHIHRAFQSVGDQCKWSYMKSKRVQLIVRTIFFFHWMAYFHYQVPVICFYFYELDANFLDWMKRYKLVGEYGEEVDPIDKYVANLYYVSGLCIGIGVYSVKENILMLTPEHLMSVAMEILGLLFMIYWVTTFVRLVLYTNMEKYRYYGPMMEMTKYLKYKRAPPRLRRKIQLFINYAFNARYFNEQAILNTLNMQIKQEINMFCCKKLVLNVPLFQKLPVALINTIIFSLVQVLYMPGEVVVKQGQPGQSIYLISSGTVAVMNAAMKEVAHLKDGAYFGERALLQPGTLRTGTIVALEITEIYKLHSEQFQKCLQPIPRIKRHLFGDPDAILSHSEQIRE